REVGRFTEGQEHAFAADALAQSAKTRERVLWLQFLSAGDLNLPGDRERLERFKRCAEPGTELSLRTATAEMTMAGHSDGDFRQELDKARGVRSLANEGTDPLVYGPFLSVYCHCLTLGGRYEESLDSVAALSRLAENYGIDHQLILARYQQA